MRSIRRRYTARRDIVTIWTWYADNAGVEVADQFLVALESAISLLAKQPNLGKAMPGGRPAFQNMRRFPVSDRFRSNVIFYKVSPSALVIVRVTGASRDLGALFS